MIQPKLRTKGRFQSISRLPIWESKLRAQSGLARRVSVSISTSPFDSIQPYRQCGAYADLRPATDALPSLLEVARRCLQESWLDGLLYHRSSVTLSELCTDSSMQPELFTLDSAVFSS